MSDKKDVFIVFNVTKFVELLKDNKQFEDFQKSYADLFNESGVVDVLEELENKAERIKYEEDKHITYWVRLKDVYNLFEVEK